VKKSGGSNPHGEGIGLLWVNLGLLDLSRLVTSKDVSALLFYPCRYCTGPQVVSAKSNREKLWNSVSGVPVETAELR